MATAEPNPLPPSETWVCMDGHVSNARLQDRRCTYVEPDSYEKLRAALLSNQLDSSVAYFQETPPKRCYYSRCIGGQWRCTFCKSDLLNFREEIACHFCNVPNPAASIVVTPTNPALKTTGVCPDGHTTSLRTKNLKCDWDNSHEECGDIGEPDWDFRFRRCGYRRPHVPGQWLCDECGAQSFNFKEEVFCHKCRAPRRENTNNNNNPPVGFKPGDWLCPMCHVHNFERQPKCINSACSATRPSLVPASTCVPFTIGDRERDRPPPMMKGDWDCPKCKQHNFASRKACYNRNCGQMRPAN